MCELKPDQDKLGCSIETLEMLIDDSFNKYGDHTTLILEYVNAFKNAKSDSQVSLLINKITYIMETRL